MSVQEIVYASWGGQGHTDAIRVAVHRARRADARLTFLAVLDPLAFGELDSGIMASVESELGWLLEAQLQLVIRQGGAAEVDARALVVRGDLLDEISGFVAASEVDQVLLSESGGERTTDLTSLASTLAERTGVDVEILTLSDPSPTSEKTHE